MTRHTPDARIAADMAQIDAAGEARAARVSAMPREAIIRLAHDDRPPLLRRLVWPGVALCVVALLALGVM